MREHETKIEQAMRRALMNELHKHRVLRIVPNRKDVVKKVWLLHKSKVQAYLLEGRLEQDVYSGDITISFRRFTMKLGV